MYTIKRRVRHGNRNRDYSYMLSPGIYIRCASVKRGFSWGNKSFAAMSGRKVITFPNTKKADEKIREVSSQDKRQYDYTIEPLRN